MWIRYECFTGVHIGHGHRTGALAGVAEFWTWECPWNLVTCLCQMIREGDKCWRVSGECKKSYSGPGSGGGGQWWWFHEETAGRQKSLLKHKTESVTVFMPHWDKITVWDTPWSKGCDELGMGHKVMRSTVLCSLLYFLIIFGSRSQEFHLGSHYPFSSPSWSLLKSPYLPVPISKIKSTPKAAGKEEGFWSSGPLSSSQRLESEGGKWGYLLVHPQSKASFMHP